MFTTNLGSCGGCVDPQRSPRKVLIVLIDLYAIFVRTLRTYYSSISRIMKYSFKQRMRQKLLAVCVFPFYLISRRGFLRRMGWFRSLRTGLPLDNEGEAIPWWSYSFILFLQERLNRGMYIFEYGSGYSTLWLAHRVDTIVSVETDRTWYQRLKQIAPANVDLRYSDYEPNGEYCRLVQEYNREFDVVIVDSRDRVRCAKNSLGALKPSGILIVDDAHQPHLKEASDYLKDNGYKKIDFFGTCASHDGMHCTTVFYRDKNCLGI